jgi:AmmeMemoRadiSam system protein B
MQIVKDQMMTETGTRPAQLAGTWYTGNPQTLQREVSGYIQTPELHEFTKDIVALVAPHAGHRYSGPVAGYAYQAVLGRSYDTVVVISPFHHGYHRPLITSAHTAYQTPLGSIEIDQARLEALEAALDEQHQLSLDRLAYDQEHAIEIQLPFLQLALEGDFKLLPLMLSGIQTAAASKLGKTLGSVLADTKTLLVASTDLSHFYSEEQANKLDQAMLDAIASLDPEKVMAVQRSGKGEACGLLAVVAVLTAAKDLGASYCRILNYATSGATSGDYSRVVGYGAGVITR